MNAKEIPNLFLEKAENPTVIKKLMVIKILEMCNGTGDGRNNSIG